MSSKLKTDPSGCIFGWGCESIFPFPFGCRILIAILGCGRGKYFHLAGGIFRTLGVLDALVIDCKKVKYMNITDNNHVY